MSTGRVTGSQGLLFEGPEACVRLSVFEALTSLMLFFLVSCFLRCSSRAAAETFSKVFSSYDFTESKSFSLFWSVFQGHCVFLFSCLCICVTGTTSPEPVWVCYFSVIFSLLLCLVFHGLSRP